MHFEQGTTSDINLLHKTPTRASPRVYCSPSSNNSETSSPGFCSPSFNYNSPSPSNSKQSSSSSSSSKRGRPKSEILTTLILEGKGSPSAIKCRFCGRVFPRDKSLNAHERIHSGIKPYICDFPSCSRAFTQSGQLKTHQRLHSGERPFRCSADGCNMRFTHANRHCSNHPYHHLIRCDDLKLDNIFSNEQNVEVLKWLERYRANREDKTPKRNKKSDGNDENQTNLESYYNGNNPKSRKGLMCELDMNAGQATSPVSSKVRLNPTPKKIHWNDENEEESIVSPINPKKRWLRDAWLDLAKPLDSTVPSQFVVEANQNRPTVLMIAKKDQTTPLELSGNSCEQPQ